MAENKKTQNISPVMMAIRKGFRLFAGIWFVFCIIFLIAAFFNIVKNPQNTDAWLSVIAAIALCIPGYLFWKIPDWLIKTEQTRILKAMNDPTKEVQIKKANTDYASFEHIEITDKNSREKYVTEDQQGRVFFDSTSRPLRLMFGGAFLVIGLIIGGLIIYFSNDEGFFIYIWLGGWVIFCLVAMGYVYEVTINKSFGIADRKAGWFIFVKKRRFNLNDFSKVIVGSTFYRQHRDTITGYHPSKEPKFNVYLLGKSVLRLRVFSHLTDARHMGEEVSAYLKLPLEEKSDVMYSMGL